MQSLDELKARIDGVAAAHRSSLHVLENSGGALPPLKSSPAKGVSRSVPNLRVRTRHDWQVRDSTSSVLAAGAPTASLPPLATRSKAKVTSDSPPLRTASTVALAASSLSPAACATRYSRNSDDTHSCGEDAWPCNEQFTLGLQFFDDATVASLLHFDHESRQRPTLVHRYGMHGLGVKDMQRDDTLRQKSTALPDMAAPLVGPPPTSVIERARRRKRAHKQGGKQTARGADEQASQAADAAAADAKVADVKALSPGPDHDEAVVAGACKSSSPCAHLSRPPISELTDAARERALDAASDAAVGVAPDASAVVELDELGMESSQVAPLDAAPAAGVVTTDATTLALSPDATNTDELEATSVVVAAPAPALAAVAPSASALGTASVTASLSASASASAPASAPAACIDSPALQHERRVRAFNLETIRRVERDAARREATGVYDSEQKRAELRTCPCANGHDSSPLIPSHFLTLAPLIAPTRRRRSRFSTDARPRLRVALRVAVAPDAAAP